MADGDKIRYSAWMPADSTPTHPFDPCEYQKAVLGDRKVGGFDS
jgi:hypothetical protein